MENDALTPFPLAAALDSLLHAIKWPISGQNSGASVKKILFVLAAVALSAGDANAGANLLTNGSFETNNGLNNSGFPGWTDPTGNFFACIGASNSCGDAPPLLAGAEDGQWYVGNGTVGEDGMVGQTFADVMGVTYQVSGWVASEGAPVAQGDFSLLINGTSFAGENPVSMQGWTRYSTTFVGTGSDTLTIRTRNDPKYNFFDNFSVTAVPEPAAWALMLTGLGMIGAMARGTRARRLPA